MPIKLIATDLDGTLMSADHLTITDYTLSTLKKAHDKGVKIAIATGRPLALVDSVLEQLTFCDYVIYANGACVFDKKANKLICENLIPNDKAKKLIEYFLKQKVFFEVYVDGRSQYQFGCEKYFTDTEFPSDFINEVIESMDGHSDLLAFLGDRKIEKITLYCVKENDLPIFKAEMEQSELSVTSSFEANLEATDKTADKGTAVSQLCTQLGITANEVIAFGDAGNDTPMLEFAAFSFAMENATQQCKKSAKFITKSNADDGLVPAIEKYVLNT